MASTSSNPKLDVSGDASVPKPQIQHSDSAKLSLKLVPPPASSPTKISQPAPVTSTPELIPPNSNSTVDTTAASTVAAAAVAVATAAAAAAALLPPPPNQPDGSADTGDSTVSADGKKCFDTNIKANTQSNRALKSEPESIAPERNPEPLPNPTEVNNLDSQPIDTQSGTGINSATETAEKSEAALIVGVEDVKTNTQNNISKEAGGTTGSSLNVQSTIENNISIEMAKTTGTDRSDGPTPVAKNPSTGTSAQNGDTVAVSDTHAIGAVATLSNAAINPLVVLASPVAATGPTDVVNNGSILSAVHLTGAVHLTMPPPPSAQNDNLTITNTTPTSFPLSNTVPTTISMMPHNMANPTEISAPKAPIEVLVQNPYSSNEMSTPQKTTDSQNPARRTRTRLTVKQKMEVLHRLDRGERQSVLAAELGCSKRALARLKQERATFINMELTEADANRKSRHSVKHVILENKLTQFLKLARRNSFPITGNAIRRAALKLRDDLLSDPNLPLNERPSLLAFQASVNWSKGFLRRCAIRTIDNAKPDSANANGAVDKTRSDPAVAGEQHQQKNGSNGPQTAVDSAKISDLILGLQRELSQYDIDCIFAVDKLFMFYKLLPNEPVMKPTGQISGGDEGSFDISPASISTGAPMATKIAPRVSAPKGGQVAGPGISAYPQVNSNSATQPHPNLFISPFGGHAVVPMFNQTIPPPSAQQHLQNSIAKRVTLVVASNVTGSVKIAPLMVGNESMADCRKHFLDGCKLPYLRQPYSWVDDTILKTWFYCVLVPAIRRFTDKRIAVLVSSEWAPLVDISDANGQVQIIPIPKDVPLELVHPLHAGVMSVFRRSLRYSLLNSIITRSSDVTMEEGNANADMNSTLVRSYDGEAFIDERTLERKLNVCAFSHLVEATWSNLKTELVRKCWLKSGVLSPTHASTLKARCVNENAIDLSSVLTTDTFNAIKTNNGSDEQSFLTSYTTEQAKSVQILEDLIVNYRLTVRCDMTKTNGDQDHAPRSETELNIIKRVNDLVTSLHDSGRRGLESWLEIENCPRSQRALSVELDRIIADYKSPIVSRKANTSTLAKRTASQAFGADATTAAVAYHQQALARITQQQHQKEKEQALKQQATSSTGIQNNADGNANSNMAEPPMQDPMKQDNQNDNDQSMPELLPELDELMKLIDPIQKVVNECQSGAAPQILQNFIYELIKVKRDQESQDVEQGAV